jgi:hypothetical protein
VASSMRRRGGLTAVDVQGGGGCGGASDSQQDGNNRSGKASCRCSHRAFQKEDVREINGESEPHEENWERLF